MDRTFADPTLNASFERDGFVQIGKLDQDVVDDLLNLYERVRPSQIEGMYSNTHDLPSPVNHEVAAGLTDAVGGIVADACPGYRVRGGSFVVKGCGEESVCKVHQDWNSVDERHHVALVCWVPLVAASESNGCLVAVPGSHRPGLFPSIRGAAVPSPHLDISEPLTDVLEPLPMAAGEVCVFAENLFHGSLPNLTGVPRPALYGIVLPDGAEMLHYHRSGDDVISFAIDEEFYYSGAAGRLVGGGEPDEPKIVSRFRQPPRPPVTAEQVVATMQADRS